MIRAGKCEESEWSIASPKETQAVLRGDLPLRGVKRAKSGEVLEVTFYFETGSDSLIYALHIDTEAERCVSYRIGLIAVD